MLKFRAWLSLLLFVHVLVHPCVHAMGKVKSGGAPALSRSIASDAGLNSSDQCELCRVGHNATVSPELPRIELLNPRWICTTLHAVNYASLQADRKLPSRAPPIV
jgi:hypothetical protein